MTNTTSRRIDLTPVRDMDAAAWSVSLTFGADDVAPTVELHRELPLAERYSYFLDTLLDCVIAGSPMCFGDYGHETTAHVLGPIAVMQVATEAVHRIPGTVGRFEVRWVPNDPEVPF
ncbi:hypothetical protein [Pulveribacter sp.]|uniref:hypothetical protein n=1 Tax=Pulveribacter sp. TaxID=2678893 RepID=UPI0028A8C6EC|nr:hypothetical protein [Pulveribacter sp.]